MNYRINYGNGQVEYPGSLAKCKRALADIHRIPGGGGAYIQRREPFTCDWFRYQREAGQ